MGYIFLVGDRTLINTKTKSKNKKNMMVLSKPGQLVIYHTYHINVSLTGEFVSYFVRERL